MGCRCKNLKRLEEKFANKTSFKPVYLDYVATTPTDIRVIGEWEKITRSIFGNPSSFHQAGLNAANVIESSREIVAEYLHAKPTEIYFCSSGTEALHCAIFGMKSKDTTYITSVAEHSAVANSIEFVSKTGCEVINIGIDTNGRVCLAELENIVRKKSKFIFAYSPVNHETGVLQDIKGIYRLVKENGGYIIMDGMQTISKLLPEEWVDYADIITLSSHKFYSVKGNGILLVRNGMKLSHFRSGGGQEMGFFPGTENTSGIAAVGKAITILKNELQNELQIQKVLSIEAIELIKKNGLKINTPLDYAVPGIINVSLCVKDVEKAIIYLSQRGICVSRFSACTKDIKGSSKILSAMGVNLQDSSDSIRISFGRFSTKDDFFRLFKCIKEYKANNI